jgi:hypothetical protein
MLENIKILALASGMKLKEFYPDEKKEFGWIIINCTEFELERYTNMLLQGKAQALADLESNQTKNENINSNIT